jgi:hypothetical protein
MKPLYPSEGYTIIEVMIVLVISTALFGTVYAGFSKQAQAREFTQAVDTMEVSLRDTLNDVSTGYYPSMGDFSCQEGLGEPLITANPLTDKEQGAKAPCIFVGKAVQFRTDDDPGKYSIFTMVGLRLAIDPLNPTRRVESAGLIDSSPRILGVSGRPGVVDSKTMDSSVDIVSIKAIGSGASIDGLAIVSNFGQTSLLNGSVSGVASRVMLTAVEATAAGPSQQQFADGIEAGNGSNVRYDLAEKGILICLRQGSGGRKASLTIGSDGQQLNIDRQIDNWHTECGP